MSDTNKPTTKPEHWPEVLKPGDDIPEDVDLREVVRELHLKVGQINDRAEHFYKAIESDLKGIVTAQMAMFQTLSERFDQAEIGARLSQLRATMGKEDRGFHHIMNNAIKAQVLREYPSIEDAPQWVQEMCEGKGVAVVAKPGDPGSFEGSEGPR